MEIKKVIKKVDWVQVGVLGLGLIASLAKSIYEAKRFDTNLNEKYNNHLEKRINEIIDKKLSKNS